MQVKVIRSEIDGVKFCHRDGFSDLKTFNEVLGKRSYLCRGLKIEPNERWMDCGGNVGAFALLACSQGADVVVYEPDPNNCKMIQKNLDLNGFKAKVVQAALVADDTKSAILHLGNNNNVWRNSLIKKWNSKGIKVPCLNFDDEVSRHGFNACKMDIEGAEMPILESTNSIFDKLTYEWSFDIDRSLPRIWKVLDRQKQQYGEVKAPWNTVKYNTRDYSEWQSSWFPPCVLVHCFRRPLI